MIEKMEGLALNVITTTSTTTSISPSFRNSIFTGLRVKTLNFPRSKSNVNKFAVFASNDEPKLDPLDQMELQFGRLLGEDPQLTIAKIMARKADPDASYLEVEKNYNKNKNKNRNKKNKGKTGDVEVFPIEWSNAVKSPPPPSPLDGMNLARPVPKKGFEVKVSKPDDVASPLDGLNLARPVPKKGYEFKVGKPDDVANPSSVSIKRPSQPGVVRRSVPNVILRKPSLVNNPDVEDKPSRVRLRRNLSLAMMGQQAVNKEEFSDMTLLRKPEPVVIAEEETSTEEEKNGLEASDFSLMPKPEPKAAEAIANDVSDSSLKSSVNGGSEDGLLSEKPRFQQVDPVASSISDDMNTVEKEIPHLGPISSDANLMVEATLVGKPNRLDPSSVEKVDAESVEKPADIENLEVPSYIGGPDDDDWVRLETLLKTGDRGEVELLSCSARGFAVSFGSIIGFLPYRNLSSKYKFLAIESWLRQKGLDPSKYRQGLGIIGEAASSAYLVDSSLDKKEIKPGREVSAEMKMEEILAIYDQEKIKFLSSFVGQKLKATVVLANRRSGKLLFSVKPREREEAVARKRSLMAKLQVGDVVKGCITKITYFGIFVEIEGVPALVHQTEVSWDATLDPSAYFKVGQTVEAKVHQLDFALDRIFLSLKEIMPDPLVEALEAVVGDRDPLDTRLQPAEAATEWTEVDSLIEELEQTEGIQSVSKGRFFLSPGLAPTFQVYMASMFENQYKLLARSGNKVQEVIVETSLDKEELKSTILTCTNRVE